MAAVAAGKAKVAATQKRTTKHKLPRFRPFEPLTSNIVPDKGQVNKFKHALQCVHPLR